jgi:glycosyltransferase involved in cell wall biosynthesis
MFLQSELLSCAILTAGSWFVPGDNGGTRMRIAFDSQIFGLQTYGGVSRYFCELAAGLAGQPNCEVAIIAPLYVNRHLDGRSGKAAVHGMRVPQVPRTRRLLRVLNGMLSRAAIAKFDPHILHQTYYEEVASRPPGCQVVLTVHDMIHELFPGYFSPFDPTRERKSAAVARADHVICVSESTRRDLIELLNVPYERVSVVHHGPSESVTPGAVARYKAERPFILHVGVRSGYKNFDTLLKAYATSTLLRGYFDLVAFGGGGFTSAERSLMRKLGLSSDRLRQISDSDSVLGSLYSEASVFVYPSLYEGFGIPLLEAMHLGCPVVCGNTSSLPEVTGDAAEFCDSRSAEDMRRAIENVVSSAARRTALVKRGQERAKLFSWERCCLETLAVYERL